MEDGIAFLHDISVSTAITIVTACCARRCVTTARVRTISAAAGSIRSVITIITAVIIVRTAVTAAGVAGYIAVTRIACTRVIVVVRTARIIVRIRLLFCGSIVIFLIAVVHGGTACIGVIIRRRVISVGIIVGR